MKKVSIEKLTLNIGAGKDTVKLEKGIKLLKNIVGIEPVKTVTNKRIPTWGLRPGLPIGCKITLRGEQANTLAKRLLEAKENILKESQIDVNGNVSFGIHEYIDIPELKYDPDLGIMGLQVTITLKKPGLRITKRRLYKTKLPKQQKVSKEEAIKFMQEEYKIKFGDAE